MFFINRLQTRTKRYLASGSLIFVFNLALAWVAIESGYFSSLKLGNNEIHLIIAEITILLSFLIHNFYTWGSSSAHIFRKFIYFHLITLATLLLRIVAFSVMDFIAVPWPISFTISVFLIILLNFVGFDVFVFSHENDSRADNQCIYEENELGTVVLESIEDAEQYNRWLSSKFEPFLGQKNLEFGAGNGTIANLVSETGTIEVCEISDSRLAFLQDRFKDRENVTAYHQDFFGIEATNSYDLIYSSNVLEHCENDLEFIEHSYNLLKPGGRFVAILPAGAWLYSNLDKNLGHFRRYHLVDNIRIRQFIKDKNLALDMKSFRFLNPLGAFGWYLKYKLLGSTKITPEDAMVMNALIPWISWLDWLHLPFGQNLLMVLEKK